MSSWQGQSRSWELTWAADDDDMTRARADDHAEVLVRMEFKAATVMSLAWQRAARRRQADCIVLCDAWEFAGKYLANTALVCDFSLSSSAAHFSSQDPVRPRQAVGLSQRSRNLLQRRAQHAMLRSENSCRLFRRFTPSAQYRTISSDVRVGAYTMRSLSLSSCHGSTTAKLCWWAYNRLQSLYSTMDL